MPYDSKQIARELAQTAIGQTYHGNSLRVAKDIPSLTANDRSTLDRWLTGSNVAADGWELQRIAMKIDEMPLQADSVEDPRSRDDSAQRQSGG